MLHACAGQDRDPHRMAAIVLGLKMGQRSFRSLEREHTRRREAGAERLAIGVDRRTLAIGGQRKMDRAARRGTEMDQGAPENMGQVFRVIG